MKQGYKRGSVRADRHNGVKGSTTKDGQRKHQSLAFEVVNSVKRNCHDHGFGSTIHPTHY